MKLWYIYVWKQFSGGSNCVGKSQTNNPSNFLSYESNNLVKGEISMRIQKQVKKKAIILESKAATLAIVLVLSFFQTVQALEWERIFGGESPAVKITDERPVCWFSPRDYWIEEPGTFKASNLRFDSLDGVLEYYAKGTGLGGSYSTHVYETTYNHLSQTKAFKEDRYYPASGNAYHIEISGVSYDPSGNVEDGYSASVSPTDPPPPNPPKKATNPNPGNGTGDQQVTATLSWLDGGGTNSRATSYDIYLSTDRELLTQSGLDDSEYKGSQIGTVYDPNKLLYGTTYFWRIDAKNMEGIQTGDIWSFTTEAISSVIYVDADATGANDGSSWADAYNHLQDALANAYASVKPVEIRVGEGTYKPDQGIGVNIGDNNATFQLIDGVILKGGYAGFGESNPDVRNRVIFETILSGDLLDNDGPNPSSYNDNSNYVVTGSTTDETTVLDGFTITAGANGGIYNYPGSPTIAFCNINGNDGYGMINEANSNPNLNDCTFSWNSSTDQGGGMYNSSSSSPTLTNCIFSRNDGSGMYNSASNPTLNNCHFNENNGSGLKNYDSSNPILANCTFNKNATSEEGGGIFNNSDSSSTLTYCTFNENSADDGGGIYNEGNLTAINCTFSKNSVNYYGGGMYNFDNSSAVLTDCTFSENSAYKGSGIYNKESDPNLADCIFSGNTANNYGGGMYNEESSPTLTGCTFSKNRGSSCGGMYNYNNSNPTLTDCIFIGNSSNSSGGAMYNYKSNPTATNCVFNGNLANADAGGMLNASESSPALTNCTFSGNSADDDGGGMYNYSTSSPTLADCTFSENSANGGGALYNSGNCAITLINCIFSENTAVSGGGAYNDENSNSIFTDCTFIGNSANYGAGFYVDDHSSSFPFDSPILINCTFSDNVAENYGGGAYVKNINLILDNCSFIRNLAKRAGGIYNSSSSSPIITNSLFSGNMAELEGGALYNSSSCEPILTNCIFSGNSASRGGGVYNYNSSSLPTLTNCTFSGNSASEEGSAIHNNRTDCTPTITNCIVWHNTSAETAISLGCTITYSNIQGSWLGDGNIDLEPLFADLGYWADVNDTDIVVEPSNPNARWIDGDYHLKSQVGRWDPNSQSWIVDNVTSPCIDTGDPSSDWTGEIWPHSKRINMGAFGSTAQASMSLSQVGDIRDLNNDDSITWDDVMVLSERWASQEAPLAEDLDRDGVVDSNDLLTLAGNWMEDSINIIPILDPIIDQQATTNKRLLFSVSAIDADWDALEYLALGLPEDALFFEQLFSWTPGPEQVGTHLITFVVTDHQSLDFINVKIIVEDEQ
jgi:parallel beta-helix repeat protein